MVKYLNEVDLLLLINIISKDISLPNLYETLLKCIVCSVYIEYTLKSLTYQFFAVIVLLTSSFDWTSE